MVSDEFFQSLYQKHISTDYFPKTSSVARLISRIIYLLYPEQTKQTCTSIDKVKLTFDQIGDDFTELLETMQAHLNQPAKEVGKNFMNEIPEVFRLLNTDLQAILNGDPAAQSEYEVIRTYPGFYAIAFYRLAHVLYELEVPILPRMITEFAHSSTGIDIHPGAKIGEYFFIDHGTGIVIGETAELGKNVKLYQGITLGALSVSKNMASLKRHPTIEDNVVIYAGATILGGETIIGSNSIIGGNVWLTHSIPANTKIYHQEQIKIH
jgi:serine O-acetyltransferase